MKNILCILFLSIAGFSFAQTKNFIDQPYLETVVTVDTFVTPDRIYLSILITEKDTKGKISVEELENQMIEKFKSIGIDIEKQLFLSDVSSNFKKYFIKSQDILKSKSYYLIVSNAQTAGMALIELENLGISNVDLAKVEYSKIEELKVELKSKAVFKARKLGEAMTKPLNQKLGAAIYISDSYKDYTVNSVSAMQVRKSSSSHYATSPKVEIQFEKIKVEVEVSVKFKIE
ncbi:SIMPL domain-containing protein [Cytophaga aurantiaca]|uniref:SIMPL domain-containing protein n=1 Tax=Cytophaga aurantiaca TaxID=29530 RepID=UPI00037303AE|nr:SIMPL domain-containing protein [Cytophaga aurantiaca]